MKGAIASVELYAWGGSPGTPLDSGGLATGPAEPRRLTLVIGAPVRNADDSGWTCRVALADLERPVEVVAGDSVAALTAALARGEMWLDALRSEGVVFTRDRAGNEPYSPPTQDGQDRQMGIAPAS